MTKDEADALGDDLRRCVLRREQKPVPDELLEGLIKFGIDNEPGIYLLGPAGWRALGENLARELLYCRARLAAQ